MTEDIKHRLSLVEQRISAACRSAGRKRDTVRLVAVSKRKPASAIRAAYALGLRDFGENYAQELRDKAAELADLNDIRWHFIGPLQRNKVQLVIGTCHLVHTVDNIPLLTRINRIAEQQGIAQDFLIQLNLSAEPTKSGILANELETLLNEAMQLPHVRCRGLMTMPPPVQHAEQAAPFFSDLHKLNNQPQFKPEHVVQLSMGMSNDFEAAIENGATLVRVGSLIFGARS